MNDEIKISIVVPVYNLEQEIGSCINSIQKQTHQNIEIIVVDDGSNDQSKSVIEELASTDSRLLPIFKENRGVTSARLTGVKVATGEWIGFVDGDDVIEPDMYERMLNNAIRYNAQISHCGYQMCFPNGRVNYFHNTGILAQQDKITAIKELLSGERIEPGLCNKLFHKSLFHSLLHDNLMDTSIKINEDLLMNYYLFKEADKSIFEDWCPYHYIVRYSSASRKKMNDHKIFDPIKVKHIIASDASEEIRESAERAYLGTCITIYNSLICENLAIYKTQIKEIRKLIIEKKNILSILGSRMKLLAYLICYIPSIYPLLYRIYEKCFQRKRYS